MGDINDEGKEKNSGIEDNSDSDDGSLSEIEDVADDEAFEYEASDEEDIPLNKDDINDSIDNPVNYNMDVNKDLIFNNDLENNDSIEFLQKFGLEQKQDYIINNHQECLSKNIEEIKKLCKVIRNKDNIIIDELHKTTPILTKYERAKILGIRIKQLNNGNKPYVNVSENILDNNIIANLELENKILPFIITRPIPNNTFEYWKLTDLEIY